MINSTLHFIWMLFQALLAITLLFPLISWMASSVIKKMKPYYLPYETGDYAIIVTAYKYTANLSFVVASLLKLKYKNYIIYVVADDCDNYKPDFNDEKVVVLKPNPPFANQVKSHFFAINHFKRPHNRITIIDSDNLVHTEYLCEIDAWFNAGFEAVQGVRRAKNADTTIAALDAVNELYYLFYDRKILFSIGSSCMLSGSGMAFTVDLYKECLGKLDTAGAGFDKVLQKRIIEKGLKIAFAEKAIVYDEKTSTADQLLKQRARWNNTWFRFYSYGLSLMKKGILHINLNQLLFGFILCRPPMFMLTIGIIIVVLTNFIVSPYLALIWIGIGLLYVAGFFLALYKMKAPAAIYTSILQAPKFIWIQIKSLLKAKKANEFSVATEHTVHKTMEELNP